MTGRTPTGHFMDIPPAVGDRVRYSRNPKIDPRVLCGYVHRVGKDGVSVIVELDGGGKVSCNPDWLTVEP